MADTGLTGFLVSSLLRSPDFTLNKRLRLTPCSVTFEICGDFPMSIELNGESGINWFARWYLSIEQSAKQKVLHLNLKIVDITLECRECTYKLWSL